MAGFLGSDFVASNPTDNSNAGLGAASLRDIKTRLKTFMGVHFDLETGELDLTTIDQLLPVPFGAAGTVLTSQGPGNDPTWASGTGVPVGAFFCYGSTSIPSGYLECNGATQLIANYPALAAAIGTTWGGDGVTTFKVPDLRGRSAVGRGTGDATDATAWTIAQKRGAEGHTLTEAELAAHDHAIGNLLYDGINSALEQYVKGWNPTEATGSNGTWGSNNGGAAADEATDNAGGDQAHNNLQPSIGVVWIIKAEADTDSGSS